MENGKQFLISVLYKFILFLLLGSYYGNAQGVKPFNITTSTVDQVDEIFYSIKDSLIRGGDTTIVISNILIRKKDTLLTKNKRHFLLKGVVPLSDTIVEIMDTVRISTDTIKSFNERVMQKIENFTKRDNLFAKLFKNIMVFEDKPPPIDTSLLQLAPEAASKETRYGIYDGRIVGNIEVEVLNTLGYSLNDSAKKPRSLLEKGGNALHVKTYKNIIKNKLLFDQGDILNSVKISESERLLRQTNYIYDAIITLKPRKGTDTVDVFVKTQDLFSLSGSGSIGFPVTSGDLSVTDVNFLGLGQQLNNAVKFKTTLPSGYNYVGGYFINNIYKTQSNGQLFYRFESGEKRFGIGVNREFQSSSIVWAGGLNYYRNDLYQNIQSDTNRSKVGNNGEDIWLGYALQGKLGPKLKNRIFITGRFLGTQYYTRPDIRRPVDYLSNNMYIGSIGYFHRSFYKANYIFALGRTEDIPEGRLLTFTGGIQKGESLNRIYVSLLASYSKLSKRIGYTYYSAGIGGFKNAKRWEDNSLFFKFLYYSPLKKLSRWKTRTFVSIRAYEAIDFPDTNMTNINRENGLRGLNSSLLSGNRKVVFNFEQDFFPDINFLGFRLGLLVYGDWAWVSNNPKLLSKENFYHGYGVGVRFRNENLIFSMVQLLIGYYPNASIVNQLPLQFYERTKYFFNFNTVEFSRPSTLPVY